MPTNKTLPAKAKPQELVSRPVGRPATYEYTDEIADEICNLMIEGHDMVDVCEKLNITRYAVYRWMDKHPEFRTRCAIAREGMVESRVYAARRKLMEAEHLEKQNLDWLKQLISFEQWHAEKIAPRMYGRQGRTEITGPGGAPLQIQTQVQIIDSRKLDVEQRQALREILLEAETIEPEEEGGS